MIVGIVIASTFGGFALGYSVCQLTSVAGWERRFNKAMEGWDESLVLLARITTTHSAKEEGA